MKGKIVVEVIPTTYEGQQATSIKVSSDLEQTSSIDKIILIHTIMVSLDMDNDFLFEKGVLMGLETGIWPDNNMVKEVITNSGMVEEALRAMHEKGL